MMKKQSWGRFNLNLPHESLHSVFSHHCAASWRPSEQLTSVGSASHNLIQQYFDCYPECVVVLQVKLGLTLHFTGGA